MPRRDGEREGKAMKRKSEIVGDNRNAQGVNIWFYMEESTQLDI